jgi:Na+-translocating ferredoxin:NAD+ oxidoreductase RnfC subunit
MGSSNTDNLVDLVRDAGVVGAGGAGFPTYKKIDTNADIVIANGAECEPLLFKDQVLMKHFAGEIVDGLLVLMKHVGATQGILAIKGRNRTAIESFTPFLTETVDLFEMEDVYPAGDEYEVVYHATGLRIPAGGYPTDIGVLVQNVETLYNVFRAIQGIPVTHSMMTVHGHVKQPLTAWLPVGMSYGDVLDFAGGPSVSDFVMIDGGPMMGVVTSDLSTPVTRISSGITVVARESNLAIRKAQSESALKRFGKSACDQCSLCTEMCPRYLLGYPIQPHLVMRSLLLSGAESQTLTQWAQACSECNICSLWACPEGLDPRGVCVVSKAELRRQANWQTPDELQRLTRDVHQLKAYRSVPTGRLTRRLGLSDFVEDAPLVDFEKPPTSVAIPLLQQAGVPAEPSVTEGDEVKVGDVIARAADSGPSVPIHASIDGIVRSVGDPICIDSATALKGHL